MCQADDVQGGEGSSPSALQMSDNADAKEWKHRAKTLSDAAWRAVREVAEGSFVDTSTPTGKLAEMVMEMAVHLGQAGKVIHDLQAVSSPRSDEEARSADTATAEERDGSLTQK